MLTDPLGMSANAPGTKPRNSNKTSTPKGLGRNARQPFQPLQLAPSRPAKAAEALAHQAWRDAKSSESSRRQGTRSTYVANAHVAQQAAFSASQVSTGEELGHVGGATFRQPFALRASR